MSEMTDQTSCIRHRAKTRFFVLFEDYLDIVAAYQHQYKIAAFLRVLETKTNDRIKYNDDHQIPNTPDNLWIEIPYSEFTRRSLGLYERSSFQIAADECEKLGVSQGKVKQRHMVPNDMDSPEEDYKVYLLNIEVLQAVLDGQSFPMPDKNNTPLLKKTGGMKKKQGGVKKRKPPVEKNIPPVKINSLEVYTEVSNEVLDTKENTIAPDVHAPALQTAIASAPSHSSFSVNDNHSHSEQTQGDDHGSPVPAVLSGRSHRETVDTHSSADLPQPSQVNAPPTTVGGITQEKPPRAARTAKPKETPPLLSAEEQVLDDRRKHWQEKINTNRGGPLRLKGECINETNCIKQLLAEYTDKQIQAIWDYMATELFPYCKNPHKIGGADILKESRPAAQELKSRREQKTKPGTKAPARNVTRLVDDASQDYETINPQEAARLEKYKDITIDDITARIAALNQSTQKVSTNSQKVKVS